MRLDDGGLPTSDPTQLTPSEYYHHITLDPVIMCVGGKTCTCTLEHCMGVGVCVGVSSVALVGAAM